MVSDGLLPLRVRKLEPRSFFMVGMKTDFSNRCVSLLVLVTRSHEAISMMTIK